MLNECDSLAGRLDQYEKSCGAPVVGKSLPGLKNLTSAAAGLGLLLACPYAEAAIHYSGEMNIVLDNSYTFYSIDMDGDGDPEFGLYGISYPQVPFGYFAVFRTSGAAWVGNPSNFSPPRLSCAYDIGPTLPRDSYVWDDNFYGLLTYFGGSYYYGNFSRARGYLGVRFQVDGENLYGWIDFQGDENGHGIIHGWAYEDSGAPIAAGAGSDNCEVVPTLNEWGMIILVSLLAAGGLAYTRKEEELG